MTLLSYLSSMVAFPEERHHLWFGSHALTFCTVALTNCVWDSDRRWDQPQRLRIHLKCRRCTYSRCQQPSAIRHRSGTSVLHHEWRARLRPRLLRRRLEGIWACAGLQHIDTPQSGLVAGLGSGMGVMGNAEALDAQQRRGPGRGSGEVYEHRESKTRARIRSSDKSS